MDNTTLQQVKDIVAQSGNIGIVAPSNPSMDEMAAGLSLYLLFKTANKNVSVASPSDPIVEVSSLVGIDKVQKKLTASGDSGDLTVSFPYTEGEIEKVSYTLEDGYLNIIVKASEQGLSFDENDVEYTRGGGKLDLVFVVGTDSLTELDSVFDIQNPDTRIINIDNREDKEQFADITLGSSRLSSISEAVADLALALGMHIDEDSAQNLLSGITNATQNFQSPKTSPLAFEMAALLMKKGAAREASASARRGINIDNAPRDQRGTRVQSQQQRNSAKLPDQNRSADMRDEDRRKFEENLQKRVAEERAREQRQAGQKGQVKQSQQQKNVNDDFQDDLPADDEDAPTDWLAPKVYKGSSEV